MLAKIYSNALMTSLNSRRSTESNSNPEYKAYTSSDNSTGRSSNNKKPVFTSFAPSSGPGTTTAGSNTVVHISTDRARDDDGYYWEDGDVKAKGVSDFHVYR